MFIWSTQNDDLGGKEYDADILYLFSYHLISTIIELWKSCHSLL